MGVSITGGTPSHPFISFIDGFSTINHPVGNLHMHLCPSRPIHLLCHWPPPAVAFRASPRRGRMQRVQRQRSAWAPRLVLGRQALPGNWHTMSVAKWVWSLKWLRVWLCEGFDGICKGSFLVQYHTFGLGNPSRS